MINIVPDIKFKSEIKRISSSSLNECMQCGTCSAVCSLAPDEKPFPRKEMIWAGWGMKDKLIGNVDIWLCHQCGDCSTHCPRGVKPANVIAAIRQKTYEHYARPSFLAKILSKPAWLPVSIAIPVVVIIGILSLAGTFKIPEGMVNYSAFFPHAWLNSSFTLITLFLYLLAFIGLKQFWKDMKINHPNTSNENGFFISLKAAVKEIVLHKKFNLCDTQKSRKIAHFLVFYGFILLLLVTAFAIVAALTHNYPLPFKNPFKIMGNVAGLMLIVGLFMMMLNRLTNKSVYGKSSYADWLFLISLFLLTISGGLVEWARFANWSLAYHVYFFHLVMVWFVIMYLPYSKFGHIMYRTLAIVYAKSINRE